MTDLSKFISILENQKKDRDWEEIDYEVEEEGSCVVYVKISAKDILFAFSEAGQFLGIVNYKE